MAAPGMRFAWMLLVVAACQKHDEPAPAPPPKPVVPADAAAPALAPVADATPRGELVVEPAPPKPGTSAVMTFEAKLDLDMNFGGMAIVTTSVQKKKKKIEIVGVEPDGTVQKRITYLVRDTKVLVDGEPKKDATPIRGKTFRVTWKDGMVTNVRRADGTPATDEEVKAVHGEEGQLQAPEALGTALAGLRLVEGQAFEVPAVVLERMVKGTYKAKRMVLTYRGKTPDGARIDAEGTLTNEDEGTLRFYLDVKAELVLDRSGWCRQAKLTGQVRAELNGSVVGSGAGSGLITATPLR